MVNKTATRPVDTAEREHLSKDHGAGGEEPTKGQQETGVEKEEKKPITALSTEVVSERIGGVVALRPYGSGEVAEFGKTFLNSLVAAAAAEDKANQMLAAAGQAKQFLSFEITRAVFDLARTKDINIHAVFGTPADVEKLNTKMLVAMGVIKREFTDEDTVVYSWVDDDNRGLYEYTAKLKEEDAGEYASRFNNRKRLNMRLSEAYKASCTLLDGGLSPDDLFYSEDDTGKLVPTIRNAPKAIGGDQGTVQMNTRKAVPGASESPTMASLVKLATARHKGDGKEADRTDLGENREGVAKLGMSDEDFGTIVNTLRRAIVAQENVYTDEMKKQLQHLLPFLQQIVQSF